MKRIFGICLLVSLLAGQALAEPLTIAAGAGYKKLVTDLATAFESASGTKTELILGNMGQIMTQAKTSGAVDVVIGEKAFLDASGLAFSGAVAIGKGILVIAWPTGKNLASIADLTKPEVKRVAMPDPQKAIYGKAAAEFLAKSGFAEAVGGKLLVVATVPQVTTYLLSGEVDAGFVNRTDIMDLGAALGGSQAIDPALYDPIVIVAGSLREAKHPQEATAFAAFLATDVAKAIAVKHGM